MSLLARIYGVYTIKSNTFEAVDVLVMQNTVMKRDQTRPGMIFDIKGSTVNRLTKFSVKDQRWWCKE